MMHDVGLHMRRSCGGEREEGHPRHALAQVTHRKVVLAEADAPHRDAVRLVDGDTEQLPRPVQPRQDRLEAGRRDTLLRDEDERVGRLRDRRLILRVDGV